VRLCKEEQLNLVCRLDLSGKMSDPVTFSGNQHGRFQDSVMFRHLFESDLWRSLADGFVGGEDFAADVSLVKANANYQWLQVDVDDWVVIVRK